MALVIVLATAAVMAATVGVGCGGNSGGAEIDGGGGCGAGGLKEAIQDLYAEIIASENGVGAGVCGGGGDGWSGTRLDDVVSAKAKFVSDSLRRMIGGGGETADGGPVVNAAHAPPYPGHGDGVVERQLRSKQKEVIDALRRYDEKHGAEVGEQTAEHVNWLMDKCVEIALAKDASMNGAEGSAAEMNGVEMAAAAVNGAEPAVAARPSDQPPPVDMDALQKRFNDLLDQFERSRASPAATVVNNCRGFYGHRTQTSSRPPPTPRPPPRTRPPPSTPRTTPTTRTQPTTKPPPTTKSGPPPRRPRVIGRFKFAQFTHKQPRVAVADVAATAVVYR